MTYFLVTLFCSIQRKGSPVLLLSRVFRSLLLDHGSPFQRKIGFETRLYAEQFHLYISQVTLKVKCFSYNFDFFLSICLIKAYEIWQPPYSCWYQSLVWSQLWFSSPVQTSSLESLTIFLPYYGLEWLYPGLDNPLINWSWTELTTDIPPTRICNSDLELSHMGSLYKPGRYSWHSIINKYEVLRWN